MTVLGETKLTQKGNEVTKFAIARMMSDQARATLYVPFTEVSDAATIDALSLVVVDSLPMLRLGS